jgi:hypothetical protein
MSVHAQHRGIQYRLEEVQPGDWRWAVTPPDGRMKTGRVRGEFQFAASVARRVIEVWHLMNRGHSKAA